MRSTAPASGRNQRGTTVGDQKLAQEVREGSTPGPSPWSPLLCAGWVKLCRRQICIFLGNFSHCFDCFGTVPENRFRFGESLLRMSRRDSGRGHVGAMLMGSLRYCLSTFEPQSQAFGLHRSCRHCRWCLWLRESDPELPNTCARHQYGGSVRYGGIATPRAECIEAVD